MLSSPQFMRDFLRHMRYTGCKKKQEVFSMKILLVNDDGYGAEGLMALYEAFKDAHEVMIVAPDTEHSGAGHSVQSDLSVSADTSHPRRIRPV